MLAMASLKAVLQGNSCLGQPAVLPCCRAYAFTALNHDSAGLSCIDDLHWEVSLDMCCSICEEQIQMALAQSSHMVQVHMRPLQGLIC